MNNICKEPIYITMTSWKKRINNVPTVLDSIMKNTIIPDSIELNLSLDEFPNKEKDLPNELFSYEKLNINWCEGNTKTFKKLIPTIQKYFDNKDLRIITIDDDALYEKTFIEKIINASIEYPDAVISNNVCRGQFMTQQAVNGAGTLYRVSFFNKFLWLGLTNEIIKTNQDDWWYTFNFYFFGNRQIKYIPTKMIFFNEFKDENAEINFLNSYNLFVNYWKFLINNQNFLDKLIN